MAASPGAAGEQPRSLSRTATAIRDLHPGYFAFVMATGIISTGTFLLGPSWLSRALLAAALAGLVVLSAALVIRVALFRSSVAADIQAPDRVFGFFTIVAGIDVLGARLAAAGHPLVTAILASLAAAVWLVLTYGVPASLLLTRNRDSVLGGVNGAWLLWVVGTQSLSVAASTLVPAWPSQSGLLAPAAAGLWSVGLVLYLLLVSLILLRWLTVPMTPETLGPPYWILMGATAITVLAGARILSLPAALPVTRATAGFVEGFSFALLGVRHLVDPAAHPARPVAARPAPLAAHLRADAVERGLPPRHVQRGHPVLRQGRPSRLHGTPRPVHALGRRRDRRRRDPGAGACGQRGPGHLAPDGRPAVPHAAGGLRAAQAQGPQPGPQPGRDGRVRRPEGDRVQAGR